MKTKQLEAIRKRAEKATKGPWTRAIYKIRGGDMDYEIADPTRIDDAIFIAHTREDIPALLAEVERLQAKLTDATSICLWSARRIHPTHKRNMYDWIDELTGEENERL